MTPIIVADRLCKWYGPCLAVDTVSFEVQAGEVMGLLGPNGSGKTTILRILTGYLRPSSGRARIADLDVVADAAAARRRVGYVPEDAPLYGGMRVREFLGFMGRLKGAAGRSLARSVEGAIQRLALGEVRGALIARLSRGYRQRVAIAQALLGEPDLLVLDEPTNGLDPHQIIEMRGLIRSLAGTHTILVSSHILSEIARVADRAAILLDGRLLAVHSLRATGSARRLRVRARGTAEEVRLCLEQVPGVSLHSVEPGGDEIVTCMVAADSERAASLLATAVVGDGLPLVELTEAPADLETIFLGLTSGAR